MAKDLDLVGIISEKICSDLSSIIRKIIREEVSFSLNLKSCKQNITEDYLTAPEAAKFLGRKLSTLYKDVHLGCIPYHRSGARKLLFSRKELENFVRKGRSKSKSEIDLEVTKYFQEKN